MTDPNFPDPNYPNPTYGFGIPGTGAPDVNRIHDYDDIDVSRLSHHHSLGILPVQASPGDHIHDGKTSIKLGTIIKGSSISALAATAAELKDTGIGDLKFTAFLGFSYTIKYVARAQVTVGVPTAGDFRIRDGGASSPTIASALLTAASASLNVVGGPGGNQLIAEQIFDCPADIAAGIHIIAAFYGYTAGAGNFQASQAGGQKRQLSVLI